MPPQDPEPPVDSERVLIARAQDGHVAAFETLIAEYLPQVRRFARAFAREPAEADDLAQEALVKVYRSIRGYRFQAAFSTWLYAVVRNAFLDEKKSRAHRDRAREDSYDAGTDEAPTGDGPTGPDRDLERQEDHARLWAALNRVPIEFRTAIVLFEIEGLSHDEIATVEKVAVGTVKSRLSRGRDHLRRILTSEATQGASRQEANGNLDGSAVVVRSGKDPR